MNVLLATDGSQYAKRAEELVASLRLPARSRIEVLRVEQPLGGDLDVPPGAYVALHKAMRQEAEVHLAALKSGLATADSEVETALIVGRPATAIVDEARRIAADLVVVGSRGHGAIGSMLLGSVAAEVIDEAPCPVLVARGPRLSALIVADDGSDGARQAEEVVGGWPFLRGLAARVVNVSSFTAWSSWAGGEAPVNAEAYQQVVDEQRNWSQRTAQEGADRLKARGVAATVVVREGDVAGELIGAARDAGADLIVVGSRGHTGLARLVLGSVARNVLFHAPCSVLIVRQNAPTKSGAGSAPVSAPGRRTVPGARPRNGSA